jgi:hypothetical protein
MRLGGCADFSRLSIWSRVSGLTRIRNESHKGIASNSMQISEKVRQRGNDETSVQGRKFEPYIKV